MDFLKDLASLSTMVQKLKFYFYWKWVNLRQVDPRCDVIPRTKSEKGHFLKYFNVKFVLVFPIILISLVLNEMKFGM